jgi:hypothetical protein
MLEQCYDGPNELEAELRKRILLAHLAFIELAVEITKYYFYRGYRE